MAGAASHRHDDHVDLAPAAVGAHAQPLLAHRHLLAPRARERAAHRDQQPVAQHLDQVQRRTPRRGHEIRPRVAAELQHVEIAVHQHARRRVAREQQPVGVPLRIGRGELARRAVPRLARLARAARRGDGDGGRARGRLAHVDLVLRVGELEEIAVHADRLRAAEPQEAVGAQCVVHQGNEPLLQHRVEVNEQVAAGDEVQARERRIAERVLAREDAHFADLLRHPVTAVGIHEEAAQPL